MRKYASSDVSRSSIRFTYSSVARHIGPCICYNSQTYTWNDVIPYKGRMIRVFFALEYVYRATEQFWAVKITLCEGLALVGEYNRRRNPSLRTKQSKFLHNSITTEVQDRP